MGHVGDRVLRVRRRIAAAFERTISPAADPEEDSGPQRRCFPAVVSVVPSSGRAGGIRRGAIAERVGNNRGLIAVA